MVLADEIAAEAEAMDDYLVSDLPTGSLRYQSITNCSAPYVR